MNNPITFKILKLLQKRKHLEQNKILNNHEIINYVNKHDILKWLLHNNYVEAAFCLTKTGKELLREISLLGGANLLHSKAVR